jgi:Vanadium chloroperoxidase N-terminal domain
MMGDAITYWNSVAQEANRVTHTTGDSREAGARGPAGSSRAFAIVHLAMHDAYFSINPSTTFGTYLAGLPAPAAGASANAAVAAAAHATLSALYPAQKAYFDAQHAAAGLSGAGLPEGHAHGLFVAGKILDARKNDPTTGDDGYASSVAPGSHRPDPDNPGQGYHAPNYGARAACFAVTTRHSLDPPPKLGSLEYNDALVEVRAKGIAPELMATLPAGTAARTPAETLVGLFWAYDGAKGLGTPPRLYNQIIRQVADAQGNTVAKNARLFALVNAAMGDAGILAWDDKYVHDLWRPVVGIREHDPSMGPAGSPGNVLDADCDLGWLPLGAPKTNEPGVKNFTPPFPAYPSGHATFGAAALQVTRRFYNVTADGPDSLAKDLSANNLSFVSEELNGANTDNRGTVRPRHTREFPDGLWGMIEENGLSRVLLGVHWVFDAFMRDPATGGMDLTQNIGGVRLGRDIANDLTTNGLVKANAAGPRIP